MTRIQHRAKFRPNLFHRPVPDKVSNAKTSSTASALNGLKCFRRFGKKSKEGENLVTKGIAEDASSRLASSDADVEEGEIESDVLEVWFSGCHCGMPTFSGPFLSNESRLLLDIGGGAVPDGTGYSLSKITLCWMVRQVMASRCGILFDDAALVRCGIPNSVLLDGSCTKATEEEKKLHDMHAMQSIHDQLKKAPLWWLLEIMPLHFSSQDEEGVWHVEYRCGITNLEVGISTLKTNFVVCNSTVPTWEEVARYAPNAPISTSYVHCSRQELRR
jgi:hypothetical protein